MEKTDNFDYVFLIWGIPFRKGRGAVNKQIYSLANKLSQNNNKVGILYISYDSVAKKYNMIRNNPYFNFKLLISKFIYSRPISCIVLYLYKKRGGKYINNRIKLLASGINLPQLIAKHIVTSYWWAVLLASERYPKENIYFILYHDYSMDIKHSNIENIPKLEIAYKSSNLILANRELGEKFGSKYPLITEGIDIQKFRCMDNINKIDDLVLVPLRSNPLKGAEYAISALKRIHEEFPEVKLVAFGDFGGKVPDFVDFRHVISDEILREYYCKATYFILPSIIEGIPEPLLEAMAAGCACISTACGGSQEVINDGTNGIIVPVKDPDSMFMAFKKLYNVKDKTRYLMAEAMKSAVKFDLNRTYEDFINAINFYTDKKK